MLKQPLHSEDVEVLHEGGVVTDLQIVGQNPFPGLRPFSTDESYLFFGREGQIDDILIKLSRNRFVTVMGNSGSGKSSLMNCGLVPVLYGGFMTETGPFWNVISTRPSASPITSLTNSILEYLIRTERISQKDESIHRAVISSILQSGSNGLVEIARYLQTSRNENIFFLIDQFEEVFRYRDESDRKVEYQDIAQHFVQLILTAGEQQEVPVYIALAMRSDFIGECASFAGLAAQVNKSNYLVPRLSRDQKRAAIEGPITVAGGKISSRLLKRLLNDIGNDKDQLPILQHALMRTWDYWSSNREPGEPIDLRHYNAIGRIQEALSQHANESFEELSPRAKEIAEVVFKNITERTQENRGMRRPCRLGLIAELAEASEQEVIDVIEHFRRPGRSFLMPPSNVPLHSESLIELSHESLMRIWNRLEAWVNEEFESASMYRRLSEAAAMYQIGKTGLWRPPDLQLALNWYKKQKPTREWAQRYDEAFERAIVFLDTSRITYEAELKNQEMMQRKVLGRTRATAIILGIAFLVAIVFFVLAYIQKLQADRDKEAAKVSAREAIRQSTIAKQQKSKADISALQAKRSAIAVEQSNTTLKKTLKDLELAKNRAEAALIKAQIEHEKAIKAKDAESIARIAATLAKEEAVAEYNRANRLFMLTKAQELASKASVQDDDPELAGLMAMQSYHFHRRYEGKKYDPYIYDGLYQSLTKLTGRSYNSFKIQGPPRVHLRSIAVPQKSSTCYISGADGRIYQADYQNLTNKPTGFDTPYPSKIIALSVDGNYLVNGSDSSFVKLYNLSTNETNTITGFKEGVNDIECLPDNSQFILATGNNELWSVSPTTGEKENMVTLPFELKSISIHPNGKLLAGATWNGQIVEVNLESKTHRVLVDELASKMRMLSVKYSPSGNSLAYGIDDMANKRGLVRILNLSSLQSRQYTGHKAGVYDVEFSPDEKLLVSAGLDKRLQLYVLELPEDLPVIMDNNNGYIWDIAFDPSSNYLIASCSESEVRVWPTDPSLLAEKICPMLHRNMTQDEWKRYVGDDIDYENTCIRVLIKDN